MIEALLDPRSNSELCAALTEFGCRMRVDCSVKLCVTPRSESMMIGELAARSGLAQSRIRFYEANGLLAGTRRRGNGYREFSPRTLHVLELILSAQQAGFSLDEIRSLLPVNSGMDEWDRDKMLALLRRKIRELEASQKRLRKHKAQVQAIVDLVENKSADVDCVANFMRVIAILRE
jgi:DNA-binding transcriptional MerR regulator